MPQTRQCNDFNILKRLIHFFTVFTFAILVVGCASKQVKHTPLDPSKVQQLQRQNLATRLPVPVNGVSRKALRDTWGASRSSGRTHEGIDIMAEHGTKVYSTTSGIIADMKDNRLGGKVIWIRGPAGSWHYYAHLQKHKRGLEVGDTVNKGDLIGYVGSTGNASRTAPHLHYGIYLGGKGRNAVNPYPYLR